MDIVFLIFDWIILNKTGGKLIMKFILKPQDSVVEGYCYGCGSQCQNKCGTQCAYRR